MNYVDSLNLFGIPAKEIPCIKGSGAPTTSTVGAVGLFYMNTDNGDVYKCVAVNGSLYTWTALGTSNTGSGGNDIFTVNVNHTPVGTAIDKTSVEIYEARKQGKTVTCRVVDTVNDFIIELPFSGGGDVICFFSGAIAKSIYTVVVNESDVEVIVTEVATKDELPNSGGNSVLCVTVRKDGNGITTVSHTNSEIMTAYREGKEIICHYSDMDMTQSLQLVSCTNNQCTFTAVGVLGGVQINCRVVIDNDIPTVEVKPAEYVDQEAFAGFAKGVNEALTGFAESVEEAFNHFDTTMVKSVNGQTPDENGNVEITIPDSGGNADCLPEYSEADNGKVLGIVDGNPAWIEATIGGGDTPDVPIVPGSHGIVWDLVNVTSSSAVTSVTDGASLVAVLTPAEGYTLGDVTVIMGGEALTGVWNADTATVTIMSVTGDVVISCVGVEQTGPVDTSPVIAQYDVLYDNATTIKQKQGFCITQVYPVTLDVDAFKATAYYDAENDYSTTNGALYSLFVYTPRIKRYESGLTDGIGAGGKIVYHSDGVPISYSTNQSIGYTTQENNGKIAAQDSRYTAGMVVKNGGIAFTLSTLDIDDSYAYWRETASKVMPIGVRAGDIIFAGKNTEYYGMANIDGTMLGAEVSAAEKVDADYAMDYGVAMTALVTDESASTKVDIDKAYAAVIEEAKNAWLTEANGNIDKIPLIIHTDQHNARNKAMWDFIDEIVDWYDIGKVINLGDTLNSYTSDLLSNSGLESYVESLSSVPYSKRIEVFGNHDVADGNDGDDGDDGKVVPQNYLYKYFRNIYARRFDNYGNFVTYDNNYNVKYVVVSGFAFDSNKGGHSYYIIPSATIDKIIAELEKADGYDVILLSHVPLNEVNRKSLADLWSGRKAKTSGSVTDEYGIVHDFDFTGCDGELLCGLHGHNHEDNHTYIGDLVDVWFDAYYIAPRAIHFVLVDRENRRLNVWKVDETPQYQNYQIPFAQPTE